MERRIHRRFARRIELRYWRQGEASGHTAFTTNISKSGLFLNSAVALQPGERLRLEVVDRDHGFFAEGRVARVHRVALALRQVEQQGVGVRFLLPEELIDGLVPVARHTGVATEEAPGPSLAGGRASEPRAGAGVSPTRTTPEPEASAESLNAPLVPVQFADASSFLSTYYRDITAGGLLVSSPNPLPLQSTVWIELHLPLPEEGPRRFPARVVQRFEPQAAVGEGRNLLSGMAVQFLEPEKVLATLSPLLPQLRR